MVGDFITSVPIEYSHPYTIELCGVISFMVFIDYLLSKYLAPAKDKCIEVGLDCQSVIDNISNKSPIIS